MKKIVLKTGLLVVMLAITLNGSSRAQDITPTSGTEVTPEATVVQEGTTMENPLTWDSQQWNWVWGDEFDGPEGAPINPDNWNCEVGGQGWGNQEWEYYTPGTHNVALDGTSSMVITARHENPKDYQCWYGRCMYTSARCNTQGKFAFTYGHIEARLQIPFGQGIWPAFWMLGSDIQTAGWPDSGEIDIMENIGSEPKFVHGTVHGPGYSGANGIGKLKNLHTQVSDDYHTFALDWYPDSIHWYVDGERYFTLTKDDVGDHKWVFDHDFFIILNVAVGGKWPGYPDATSTYPQTMKVDYVRVYQLAKGSS